MVYEIRNALSDPLLNSAIPTVLSGSPVALNRAVRWAHASEQLDVAALLLGGELLFSGGVHLGGSLDDACHIRYVDALVEAGVAGVAIETSARLPAVPTALVDRARTLDFVVIALRRQVPFVQICQSINTRLSALSMHQLQLEDILSSALTKAAARSADLNTLAAVVAESTRATATIVSTSGAVLGSAGAGTLGHTDAVASFAAPLLVGQETVGLLLLSAHVTADVHRVSAALDRAPATLAVTTLQQHPPTEADRLGAAFVRLLTRAPERSAIDIELDTMLARIGMPVAGSYLCVAVRFDADAAALAAARATILSATPDAVVIVDSDELVGVLGFGDATARERARTLLVDALRSALPEGIGACVGVGARTSKHLRREFATVRAAADWGPGTTDVIDARDYRLHRLQLAVERGDSAAESIDDILGPLLDRAPELLETLGVFAACWGSKTVAARELRIGRQTLYDRIARIESLLGTLQGAMGSNAAIMAAALLTRRSTPLGPPARRHHPAPLVVPPPAALLRRHP